MGADHGQAPSQDPRGLRALLRQHPPQEGPRVNHGTVAGEPGELKGSRRVREGARGNGALPPPRLWPTSSTRSYDVRHLARVHEQAVWLSRRRRRWCRHGVLRSEETERYRHRASGLPRRPGATTCATSPVSMSRRYGCRAVGEGGVATACWRYCASSEYVGWSASRTMSSSSQSIA